MKKKMIFALLLAGMSFVAPNVADAQGKAVAQETQRSVAGAAWTTYYDINLGGGIRLTGCDGAPTNCVPGN